jgi:hypothetical protein
VSWDSASREIPTGSGPSVGRGTRGGDPAPSAFRRIGKSAFPLTRDRGHTGQKP